MITEPILQKYYQGLDQGKILARKCKKCGSYEFPPAPFCQECGASDQEWIELSGEGVLNFFTIFMFPEEHFSELGPYAYGSVKMQEGKGINAIIQGIDLESPEEEFYKCPRKVKAEIKEFDGVKTVTFTVV